MGRTEKQSTRLSVADVVAASYREILPSEVKATANGPIVHTRAGDRKWTVFGGFLLGVPFLTPKFRLQQRAGLPSPSAQSGSERRGRETGSALSVASS